MQGTDANMECGLLACPPFLMYTIVALSLLAPDQLRHVQIHAE